MEILPHDHSAHPPPPRQFVTTAATEKRYPIIIRYNNNTSTLSPQIERPISLITPFLLINDKQMGGQHLHHLRGKSNVNGTQNANAREFGPWTSHRSRRRSTPMKNNNKQPEIDDDLPS